MSVLSCKAIAACAQLNVTSMDATRLGSKERCRTMKVGTKTALGKLARMVFAWVVELDNIADRHADDNGGRRG